MEHFEGLKPEHLIPEKTPDFAGARRIRKVSEKPDRTI